MHAKLRLNAHDPAKTDLLMALHALLYKLSVNLPGADRFEGFSPFCIWLPFQAGSKAMATRPAGDPLYGLTALPDGHMRFNGAAIRSLATRSGDILITYEKNMPPRSPYRVSDYAEPSSMNTVAVITEQEWMSMAEQATSAW